MHETLERVTETTEAGHTNGTNGTNGAHKANGTNGTHGTNGSSHAFVELPVVPNLGRTVQVVGEVVNVDVQQMPHPKNQRGELGKALFNWYRNTISKDPLTRVSANNHYADKRNFLTGAVATAPKGEVNPRRVQVDDPAAMARHIKKVSRTFGADLVGIAPSHPSIFYASGERYVQDGAAQDEYQHLTPEELARRFPFVIVSTTAWDYRTLQAHRHIIGDASYHFSGMRAQMVNKNLEGYIRELGYTALRGVAVPQAAGLAAGLGELGRNGMMISDRYGARIHMPDPVVTDLPLMADKPIDIGVDDFCKICRKCAVTCPTNSISFEDKVVFNGVKKYKINWLTCYKLRPFTHEYWTSCLTCIAICPFTKPDAWWRRTAGFTLKTAPIAARPPIVRGLKWLDDKIWGIERKSRVRFMGYDSGIKPGQRACTVAGCTATHADAGDRVEDTSKTGYYFPLKENTNRFVRRDKV